MKKNAFLKIIIFSLTILISGCKSAPTIYDYTISTSVDATADTLVDQNNYTKCYLVTEYDTKSIKGRRASAFFKDSFSSVGIDIISDKSKANCFLFVEFNTEQKTYTENTPIWGQTGISSARSSPNYTGGSTITYQPSYGITGYVPTQRRLNIGSLNISARTKSGDEIWKVFVTMQDVSDNAAPVLINAAAVHSRTNKKTSWAYSQLELDLLLQHRAKELTNGGTTRLHPLTEKVSDINTISNWNACEEEKTIDVLTRWTERTGYKLDINDNLKNKKVKYDKPYQGKFADVLSEYLSDQEVKPVLDTSKKILSFE